jgi:hypothetical protein
VERLGLDKSLASRLIRALRCESDSEFLHRVPSPGGLRIFLAGAGRVGTDPALLEAAEEEVERFQEFIHLTPGGMDAIDAHISELSPEVRAGREHVARQAIYKSMSFLLGYYCETLTTTLILLPSENGRNLDGVELHQRVGMRGLRPNTPLAMFSVVVPPAEVNPGSTTWIEPIGGLHGPVSPEQYILSEHSTQPIPHLEILSEGAHTTFVLEDLSEVGRQALTLSSAFRLRNVWPRFATDAVSDLSRAYVLPLPCRMLVRDLLIAEELFAGTVPELTHQLQSPAGPGGGKREGLAAKLSTLDLVAPIEQLRCDARGLAISGLPRHPEAVLGIFEAIGQDPARFRGYRCTIAYPVPLIEMSWRLRLGERP